jgi:hypothetical protein
MTQTTYDFENRWRSCPADHDELPYHGHSDCLNNNGFGAVASLGHPFQWIVYTWPCRACGLRFAWMLTADGIDADGDWAGSTSKGVVFPIPGQEWLA